MALVKNGEVALISYIVGFLLFVLDVIGWKYDFFAANWLLVGISYVLLVNVAISLLYSGPSYPVAIRGLWLGIGLALSLGQAFSHSSFRLLGWYTAALAVFHFSEYIATAISNPRNLSLESFLLDHSKEYHIAIIVSMVEFFLEWYFFPWMKQPCWLSLVGVSIVIAGEVLRKGAMLNASTNFNHYVQHLKRDGHQLVTTGFYGVCRHPSYVGWFYWSVATQLMLANPLCFVAYVLVSWKFFQERIECEEIALINFFGEEYLDYQEKVGSGLPFIKGWVMKHRQT